MKKNQLKKAITLLCLTCSMIRPAAAVEKENTDVTISVVMGSKSNVPDGSTFEVHLVKNNTYYKWNGTTKTYVDTILNGKCKIIVPASDKIAYACFELQFPDGSRKILDENNYLNLPYLLETGDQIQINIFQINKIRDFIQFSGKGAEKISCQQQIYQLRNALPLGAQMRANQLLNTVTSTSLKATEKLYDINLSMKLALLATYRDRISDKAYQLIYYDCVGARLYSRATDFIAANARKDFITIRPAIKKYFEENLLEYTKEDPNNQDLIGSALYSMSITQKILVMQILTDDKFSKDFSPIYAMIKKNFDGALRDRLWLNAIMEHGKYKNANNYVDSIFIQMGNNSSKAILNEWRQKNDLGREAYPFVIEDEKGKKYTLADFKGKIIVADFWFRGCTGCKSIVKSLSPVSASFSGNDNIVFLSISVDKTRDSWIGGLKDREYTIPNSLHLWTGGGMISNTSFLKYYNYFSFPQLLLIDKKGKLIASRPTDPRNDKAEALIRLIKENM
ncbi:TlpA disulfide reductase family protein [Pedobacter psychrodurus]|uniref:TlpA family protein disulfide reductase n=1 Tax=Pedobacter psychrodurus TaxID=2530456 RepID=UPI002931CA12|nr:TlpA disulfide reductase family protein [Pedobacter psychrodurus]